EEERLDLVIVSDQLLTGFDSKFINMIYMDKMLKEGMLIQAMSRTNRTLNRDSKPHGKVRFYRQGDAMKEYVENALRIYTRGGNDTLQEAEEEAGNQELKDLENDDILAKPQSHQIQELEGTIARLKELAGDDFSQVPRGTNDIREFVNLAFPAQSKIQQLIQQGYELGTEIDVLDDNNEPTGEMIRLDIANTDEFGALQARLYDTKEKLPESERPDLTEIKIGIEFFDHEIIDYDMLVELLNNFMDEKTEHNREAIDKHITPMDDESRQEINEIVDDIESGEITEHFTTETLQQERKKRRTNLRELKIRRWAADQDVNGNRVVEAFDLFLPGHTLIDNPNLADLVREIEKEENIDFFGAAEFEEALMKFFNSL
ncbi:MAG: type I restriction endonuclease subunit R, partial [Enterococcus faecalis]|nr:type I restriction endonuclease subunit R [Enterococcus faecalis]